MNSYFHPNAGFSLLELLIATLVISTLCVAGTIYFPKSLLRSGAKTFADEVISFFQQQCLLSISSQSKLKIQLTERALKGEGANSILLIPSELTLSFRFGGSNGRSEAFCYPSGTTSAGTLTIQDNNNLCEITASLSGRLTRNCNAIN